MNSMQMPIDVAAQFKWRVKEASSRVVQVVYAVNQVWTTFLKPNTSRSIPGRSNVEAHSKS